MDLWGSQKRFFILCLQGWIGLAVLIMTPKLGLSRDWALGLTAAYFNLLSAYLLIRKGFPIKSPIIWFTMACDLSALAFLGRSVSEPFDSVLLVAGVLGLGFGLIMMCRAIFFPPRHWAG
jgi:hypothetical protein